MTSFCLLESWLIREAGFWILTRRKEGDLGVSTCADRADGPRFTLAAWAGDPLARYDVQMRVLLWTSGRGSHDITLSCFTGCILSSKNTSWRPADLLTLIQSWQSVVHLETWGANASKLWWQGGSASQRSAEAPCIDFLHCDAPEHCAWRASTSAHKQLLVARPGASGCCFCSCSVLVLQWAPATWAARRFCAGNALPVNAYFKCGVVPLAHSWHIILTCAQIFPLHCPVHALQWAWMATVRAWHFARFRLHHERKLHVTHSDRERPRESVGVCVLVWVYVCVRESEREVCVRVCEMYLKG